MTQDSIQLFHQVFTNKFKALTCIRIHRYRRSILWNSRYLLPTFWVEFFGIKYKKTKNKQCAGRRQVGIT